MKVNKLEKANFALPFKSRKMFKNKVLLFHLITAAVVTIWGVTFVSTKVLLQHGLGPIDIMFYRFVLAYFCILAISHKRLWAASRAV